MTARVVGNYFCVVAVLTALGERDAQVRDAERRAR
jgi:hypothetical protein